MRWRLLAVNPVDGVEPPHVERTEAEVLTPRGGQAADGGASWLEFEVPILMGLFCGLRPTEYLALRWQDVDLERRELRVRQNVHRVKADRVTEHMGVTSRAFGSGHRRHIDRNGP